MSDTATAISTAPDTSAAPSYTPPTLDAVFSGTSAGPSSPSPTPEPTPVEPVVAAPPVEPVKAPDTTVKKPDTPTPDASAAPPSPPAAPTPPNWNDDANPYKKRHADTAAWANRVHQQNLDFAKQLDVINKKLDGTYDPETDDTPAPSVDEIAEHATMEGKVAASVAAARDQFGRDKDGTWIIDKLVFSDNSPYARLEAANPAIAARVLASDAPALEAMQGVREHIFFEKYGRDPDTIISAIRKEVTESLRESIRQEELDKLQKRLALRDTHPTGLGEQAAGTAAPKPAAPPRTAATERFASGDELRAALEQLARG